MTIREALRCAEEILLDAGVPDARLDAEYLLAGVLDAPRLLVVASGETPLTDTRAEQYFALVARRQGREPLQYILGTQPFMGCSFYVDKRVLIPRANHIVAVSQNTKRDIMRFFDVPDWCVAPALSFSGSRKSE